MVKRILLCSPERSLSRFISIELQKFDYSVDFEENGKTALKQVREREYDLILADFQLGDMNSQEFAKEINYLRPATIIIVMASCEEVQTNQEAIGRYAVSIIVKPFVIAELLDLISRIFRGRDFIDQNCSLIQTRTAYQDLRLDRKQHVAYRGEELLLLTRREYDLLATLMASHTPLSREQLLERVWKYESTAETNIVDVYIRYLRSKIDVPGRPSYIQTIRGVGYGMRE
ncbi:response regulator transcription factor [Streptococcus ovuberis]|uniref:Response regulator transcription factor n=1 Tax=Streptococcus ovuberis TaxID=1936207 RepID=A0A7X6S2C0_9STRE|nr:response regulator transcription factor [Streptococcus ovuberis]NKZ21230.1 response regulator transcription factor [Streptococcus ovuberis]